MKMTAVYFEPEDWLVFREIRRFNPSDRVESIFPSPFPFYGALRSALLRKWGVKLKYAKSPEISDEQREILGNANNAGKLRLFGPFIFERDGDGNVRHYFPAPKNIYKVTDHCKKEYKEMPVLMLDKKVEADELKLDLAWKPEYNGASEAESAFIELNEVEVDELKLDLAWKPEYNGASEAESAFIELNEFERLHRGESFTLDGPRGLRTENQIGVGLETDMKHVKEGMIYSITRYRFVDGGFFMLTDDEETLELLKGIDGVFLGGKQRWANVKFCEMETHIFEPVDLNRPVAVSLLTPALFDGGIAPKSGQISNKQIVAIVGAKKVAISGWDLENNTNKPIYHAAAPGSVYYLNGSLDTGATLQESDLTDFGFGKVAFMSWEYFKGEV